MTDPEQVSVNVAKVEQMLTDLLDMAVDDEAAHSYEDEMYHLVLEAVAAGHPDSATLASTVLRSKDIDFARWCA